MSAKLGSRKARLGLMRLGAVSARPFLTDLPSSLELDGHVASLALDTREADTILDGDARTLDLDDRRRTVTLDG